MDCHLKMLKTIIEKIILLVIVKKEKKKQIYIWGFEWKGLIFLELSTPFWSEIVLDT